ncbi:UDP-N-acetylmuramate dehydrogenase [Commensalibacter papalotli (ex Botero et al. 2024)]|uniref:UDP-N-acetylenolpyruvoylglucosamine reductase n=1 Tax=Commensalibacter papalotli (ex Botero et al. 2024) TaxID=2972766 RepID=A0ABN8W907_9PROT|nr:UDP-N-acetylmuramate dehydrogenase [Commensalibacter papalotli (ex Botero et al. 2024)]CAI3936086.1 UDP-N-acetylenolpyruvoylglucosamine reductase (MurB) (PDB:2MBR) [Commensalibacter papalotli (ex Botero et al. 2024)]CAI3939532.1 UDP-N-acetylenolpyruvoylglucosamine reductase (MurB) (PDB:2MBR) [Commensalibacter papalotli (ex Botero et al. 2024)]
MQQGLFTKEAFSDLLPKLQGKINFDVPLNVRSWFRVGGNAEILINPANDEDLAYILYQLPLEWPIFTLGATSNLLIRDGGIPGVNFQLRKGFNEIIPDQDGFIVGAACLDTVVAEHAAATGIKGLEFLIGIPGSIGGAVKMNAGAHGSELSNILDWIEIITREGKLIRLSVSELGLSYRHSTLPQDAIVTKARLQGLPGDKEKIIQAMNAIKKQREDSQPIRSRTGGSTFRNPDPSVSEYKAWQLIDMVSGRGLTIGGAQVSEKHCNFLINTGTATAADIENLGEELKKRVMDQFSIALHWEIKRIGRPLQQ